MKSDKEKWSIRELISTIANTPHEIHSFIVGFAHGFSEGAKYSCNDKYKDEEAYYAVGWSIGEIIDRIKNNNPEDTKLAIAQSLGIIVKYAIIGAVGAGVITII